MDWLVLVFSSANVLFGKFLVFNKHTKQVNQNAKKMLEGVLQYHVD